MLRVVKNFAMSLKVVRGLLWGTGRDLLSLKVILWFQEWVI